MQEDLEADFKLNIELNSQLVKVLSRSESHERTNNKDVEKYCCTLTQSLETMVYGNDYALFMIRNTEVDQN